MVVRVSTGQDENLNQFFEAGKTRFSQEEGVQERIPSRSSPPTTRTTSLTTRNIRSTSREAYQKLTEEGVKQSDMQRVYELLKAHPEGLTMNEISHHLRMRINQVCGRVGDLRKIELSNGDGLVTDGGTKMNLIRRADGTIKELPNLLWTINKVIRP